VGASAQVLAFSARAQLMFSDGSSCSVDAPQSLVRAKGFKNAVTTAGGTYRMVARLNADSSPSKYVEL
jgi:hypothetical protein